MMLVFATESAADSAQAKITGIMGFSDNITVRWAIPQQRATDGKWYFEAPADRYMVDVTDYTAEPFSPSWYPDDAARK